MSKTIWWAFGLLLCAILWKGRGVKIYLLITLLFYVVLIGTLIIVGGLSL